MARPIKMHEDILFKVMQKSLTPLVKITAGISKAIIGNKESQIEGARRAEQLKKNALDQTAALIEIAKLIKEGGFGSAGAGGKGDGKDSKDSGSFFGWKSKALGAAIVAAVAASPLGSAIAGMQSMYGFFTSGQGPAMFAKKWKEVTTKWTTAWDGVLKKLSENKLVKTISEKWTAMKTKVSGWWKRFDIFGTVAVTKEGGATGGRFTAVMKWLTKIMLLKPIQFLAKWVRPVYALFGIFDIFSKVKEGDEKNKEEGKTVAERVASGANTARTTFLKWFFDEMIIGTIGTITNLFTSWFVGKKWKEGTGHDWAERFTKFREDIEKAIWGWLSAAFKFIVNVAKDPKAALKRGVDAIKDAVTRGKKDSPTQQTTSQKNTEESKIVSEGGTVPGVSSSPEALEQWDKSPQNPKNQKKESGPNIFQKGAGAVSDFFGGMFGGDSADPKEQTTGATPIPEKTRWNSVGIDSGVSDIGMKGTKWSLLGGLEKITQGILGVWNSENITGAPVFTSGKRSVDTNKKSGGVKHSQHIAGSAFDIRNRYIPIENRDNVFKKLESSFGGQVKGVRHKELDGTPYQHFHFQKAAKGFFGQVKSPTLFLTGEAGDEFVNIQPQNSPNNRMNNMNQMQMERAMSQTGTPPIAVIDNSVSTTSSPPSSPMLIMNQLVRSKQYAT